MKAFRFIFVAFVAAGVVGCASNSASTRAGYQTLAKDPSRDTALAAREQAAGLN